MSSISKPNTFSPNTTMSSSQVNSNFDTIYNDYNGGISAANLASGAVTTAKIADSNVTTAKIADSNVTTAKIADDAVTPAKWVNPYCFRASAAGVTSLIDGASTKIVCATEQYDYNSNYASPTYTAPVAGVYHFGAAFTYTTAIATGVYAYAAIFVNGTLRARGANGVPATATAPGNGFSVNTDLLLAANDTVEFYGFHDSAGNENVGIGGTDDTYFYGHLIHQI